ncbi:sucrose synthase 2 [Dorcoceras hygrometricum]|uniref:Sucrose synthase 2 n=1 Tax=Dorcoceras hygrometricum TaxID=472368 RepID=A0A2Z7B0T1_9LAMI|nr:sucrose synthase 2 [Dorcoceras hygrometricum]
MKRQICWGTLADPDHASWRGSGRTKIWPGDDQYNKIKHAMTIHRVFLGVTLLATRACLRPVSRGNRHFTVGGGRLRQSGPRPEGRLLRQPALEGLTRSARTDSPRQVGRNKFRRSKAATAAFEERREVAVWIQLAVGPQPLWLWNHNSGPAQRIMVKCLATSPHDPLGIIDSACKNQSVVVSVQYGPFNPYIPIRSTTIGKSRVAKDPIAMHTSWRSNSDIASATSIGYPRMSASGESSTTMHRLLHASGSHPIPPPNDPNLRHQIRSITLAQYQPQATGNQTQATVELTIVDIYSQLDNQSTHTRTVGRSVADPDPTSRGTAEEQNLPGKCSIHSI